MLGASAGPSRIDPQEREKLAVPTGGTAWKVQARASPREVPAGAGRSGGSGTRSPHHIAGVAIDLQDMPGQSPKTHEGSSLPTCWFFLPLSALGPPRPALPAHPQAR